MLVYFILVLSTRNNYWEVASSKSIFEQTVDVFVDRDALSNAAAPITDDNDASTTVTYYGQWSGKVYLLVYLVHSSLSTEVKEILSCSMKMT